MLKLSDQPNLWGGRGSPRVAHVSRSRGLSYSGGLGRED
jgi:hypothetical protein